MVPIVAIGVHMATAGYGCTADAMKGPRTRQQGNEECGPGQIWTKSGPKNLPVKACVEAPGQGGQKKGGGATAKARTGASCL